MVWNFIGVYVIEEHYTAASRYQISVLVIKTVNTGREIKFLHGAR